MNFWNSIQTYIQRDFALEWKKKTILGSSLLYMISVVFICLHAFEWLEPDAWNALFWIVLLFTILTVTGRSFYYESGNRFAYHYHVVKPQIVIGAKLIENGLYSMMLSVLAMFVFSIFLGNEIQDFSKFILVLLLGSSGIGFTFTLTSGLSTRVNGNLVLTSILSIPLILPIVIISVQITASCFTNDGLSSTALSLFALFILNCFIIIISSLLFPYLWRD